MCTLLPSPRYNYTEPTEALVSSEICDLCEISDLLLFVSYFAS